MTDFTEPTIHQPATIDDSVMVGENCTIWQYATICAEVVMGESVVVGSHVWIGRGAQIGAFTRIQHGAFIPNHTQIGKGCFIGPNCSMTDDRYPKAGRLYRAEPPILEDDCSLGAHCVILPGVRIGRGAMVGAGAVVCEDVAPFAVVTGCPARAHFKEVEKEPYADFNPHT